MSKIGNRPASRSRPTPSCGNCCPGASRRTSRPASRTRRSATPSTPSPRSSASARSAAPRRRRSYSRCRHFADSAAAPTDVELEALSLLATTPARPQGRRSGRQLTVEQLVEAADARLQQVEAGVRPRTPPPRHSPPPARRLRPPQRNHRRRQLEALAQETNATWYPWGRSIVVLPKEARSTPSQLGRRHPPLHRRRRVAGIAGAVQGQRRCVRDRGRRCRAAFRRSRAWSA